MEDFLRLEIPSFVPVYEEGITYGYKNAKEKARTKEVLCNASKGYCMYCFCRIQTDGKIHGNLEHAIEKNNSEQLVECIPNIGLACQYCNQSFKRLGEKKRKLPLKIIKQFEEKSPCHAGRRKQCTVPCSALRELQDSYSRQDGAQILLQPMKVMGQQTGEWLELEYDVLNMEFQPASACSYSEEEKDFIREHIKRFRLNDPQFRSRKLFLFLQEVIDANGSLQNDNGYENKMVELFADKLKDKTKEERLKICNSIYKIVFLKMQ